MLFGVGIRACGVGELNFWLAIGVPGFEFESFEVVGCST